VSRSYPAGFIESLNVELQLIVANPGQRDFALTRMPNGVAAILHHVHLIT